MTKFYVHRSNYAWVTEVTEVEAKDIDAAYEAIMNGEGELLGHSIGDNCNFMDNESVEVLEAAPHNIPANFSAVARQSPQEHDFPHGKDAKWELR